MAVAAGPTAPPSLTATARATPVAPIASDVVVVYEARQLSDGVGTAALAAVAQAGGAGTIIGDGELGLFAVQRGGQTVSAAPGGMRYPMSTEAMPPELAGRIMSRAISRALALGQIVMGATSAGLHGVKVGDTLVIQGWNGLTYGLTVGVIGSDEVVGSELLVSPDVAAAIGFNRPSSAVLWGFRSRADIDAALAAQGLVRSNVRIRRSWDPPDPDGLLPQVQIKTQFGEFAYSGAANTITLQAGWVAAHLSRAPLGLGITAFCNNGTIPALQGALAEVAAAGLAAAIDVHNTNTFGGCFNPSEITPLGSTTGGIVSKHTWAIAIDMNTVENPEGSPPTMNCGVVRIFRKWGFAWGGNFLQGDGMHFEFVGGRRDLMAYPSRYCPNVVPPATALGPSGSTAGPSVADLLTMHT
jgi:hypothetical protein